jgi:hypothetical protein
VRSFPSFDSALVSKIRRVGMPFSRDRDAEFEVEGATVDRIITKITTRMAEMIPQVKEAAYCDKKQ